MTPPGGILPGGVLVWGGNCDLPCVAALPSKRRDPCSESNGAGLSKKRDEVPRDPCSATCGAGLPKKRGEAPLLRVAGRPYSPRDPRSETCGAGLSKKRVEDPCITFRDMV